MAVVQLLRRQEGLELSPQPEARTCIQEHAREQGTGTGYAENPLEMLPQDKYHSIAGKRQNSNNPKKKKKGKKEARN